jgi:hypothetical protein
LIPAQQQALNVGRNAKKLHVMKQLLFLLLINLAFTATSNGQDTAVLKRTPYTLKIAVDKKAFYEEQIGATPYIFPNNGIQIYPGETIFLEVVQENDSIKSMKAVKQITNPEITLSITFSQKCEKKAHQMMMLQIQNPFSKNLTYEAKMFLLTPKKWVNTDVYPIGAGLSGIETWPDIIISLSLSNWKFTNN